MTLRVKLTLRGKSSLRLKSALRAKSALRVKLTLRAKLAPRLKLTYVARLRRLEPPARGPQNVWKPLGFCTMMQVVNTDNKGSDGRAESGCRGRGVPVALDHWRHSQCI